MMRIAALNDSTCESSNEEDVGPTLEALEADAARVYRNAISHLAKEEIQEAKDSLFEVLTNPYIENAGWGDETERSKTLPQDIALKYSCYKNLGNISMTEKSYEEAYKFYMKAVHLDSTEVTLWQKLGSSAIKIKDFQLAVVAFQEGLLINPNHWPCLDQLLSVLFLLGFYEDCLGLAILTLKRDPHYIKALAFKDKIFELQPSLVEFAKEYFKGSDILFNNSSYDKSKGDKFINTCMELRPKQKEPRPPSPVLPQTIKKELEEFNWVSLAFALKQTYDELVNEDSKIFVAKLELRHLIQEYADTKNKASVQENLKSNLLNVFKPGRRLSRSLSYNDDALSKVKGDPSPNNDGLPSLGDADKSSGPKRRQTIEIGEGQESFRVGSRRSSSIESESEGNMDVEMTESPIIKINEQEKSPEKADGKDCSENIPLASIEEKMEVCKESNIESDEINKTPTELPDKIDKTTTELQEKIISLKSNDETNIEKSAIDKQENNEKAQAAADQLKDIMAIKPSTEILNITHKELGLDDDFYECFDGGVYEEEDEEEEEEDEEMESEEVIERAQSDVGSKIVAQESECIADLYKNKDDDDDIAIIEDVHSDEKENTDLKTVEKSLPHGNKALQSIGQATAGGSEEENGRKDTSSAKESTNQSINQPVAPKKPKRGKRGLERELEQLDYWGRRKAKEAKRRRRTLTSKLVGDFEDNEYLTWAHLIRSFIPSTLLSLDESSAGKETSRIIEEGDKDLSISRPIVPNDSLSKEEPKQASSAEKNSDIPSVKTEVEQKETKGEKSFKFIEMFKEPAVESQWNLEELEVGEFLYNSEQNGGILDVMQRCQKELIKKYNTVWPLKCAVAYIDLYQRIRNHITVGATLSSKEDPERLHNFASTTLIYLELLMSLNSLSPTQFSNREDPIYNLDQLIADENSLLEDDLFDMQLLLGRPDVWNEEYFQAHLRIAWIQSRIKILRGLPEDGVFYLQMVLDQMTLAQRENEAQIKIERCKVEEDSLLLSYSHIKNELNVLQRSQMLENIEAKFRAGHYEEIVEILTSYFSDPKSKLNSEESCPPRHTQLLLLIEALVNLNDVKGILQWGSLCLNDAVDNFHLNELVDAERNKWIHTIKLLLLLISEAVLEEPREVCETPLEHIMKMISTLVNILVIQLELGASLPQPYFSTLAPWIILHFILARQEEVRAKNNDDSQEDKDKDSEDSKEATPLPSTLLLITAHDELGKNGWCCLEDGKLLLYMMDALMYELQRPISEEQKSVIHHSMEQIIFCLFAHPSRKTKYRHLRDHGGQSIPLTFPRALQLYKYYLPSQLPEFQSEQFPSISDDVAVLFRRILSLTPDEYKYPDQTKLIEDYIEGKIDESQLRAKNFPQELKDCYYLLADNFFKGKEWEQAIHYYKLDVSININRIDSWAPMGLAKKAQLETLLNSCEVIKNTEEFFKDAQRASKCLYRVLQLDKCFCNIWVEKGGLVYMIHSHASRLLNQDLTPDMSIEMFESLEKIKADMLSEAFNCFNQAYKIVEDGGEDEDLPDERWLYQYMLGKLAEKTGKNPKIILTHYLDAMRRLHNMGATYPAKINYNTPLEYAVEALEVFFRVHVFVFKYLIHREGKDIDSIIIKLFKDVIEKMARSPFVLSKEKVISEESNNKNGVSSSVVKTQSSETDDPPSKKLKMDENEQSVYDLLLNETLKDVNIDEIKETGVGKDEKSTNDGSNDFDDKERVNIVSKCIDAFELCVVRFTHHYKSLYKLAYFYHNSKTHKDSNKAKNILLGCDASQNLAYMPSSGLFNEKKISLMNPKNSNLFYGVWRIPHDEIDRPGSFAAHMYRCVSLCLDILHETKDFYTVLEIAISLRHSPDKDKKYLRDNERELLFEHSTQVGIQTMKDKFRFLFKSSPSSMSNAKCHSFVIDVYKAYKQMGRYLPVTESPFSKMLVEAFTIFKNFSNDSNVNVLREAEKYCIGNSSTMMSTAVNPIVHYQSNLRNVTPPPPMPGVVRRGRPPGPSRDFGSYRFRAPQDNKPTTGQSVAVQQAYKVYENLIHAQTILNNKNLDEKSQHYYKGKHEEYKQQMLKYLQIPSVSQFFHSSLQNLGTAASKLPPPPSVSQLVPLRTKSPPPVVASKPSTTTAPQVKQSLNSLAERSKVHGISISSVSKKAEPISSKPVKPSMSITLSQTKPTATTNKVSIVNLEKSPPKTNVPLPKLPPGTTLSRQVESITTVSQKTPTAKDSDPLKVTSISTISTISSKGSITITQAKPSDTPTTKKPSKNISFQAVFQASLAKPKLDIKSVSTKEALLSPTPQQLQQGIKISALKYLKSNEAKRWENVGKNVATTSASSTKSTIVSNASIKHVEPTQSKPVAPKQQQEKKSFNPVDDKDKKETCVITLD